MATPVFCCGGECGVSGSTGTHWPSVSGTASFDTGTVRSGSRSLRCNPTAGGSVFLSASLGTQTVFVGRCYIRFAVLPNAVTNLFCANAGQACGAFFNSADNKIYAGRSTGLTLGASGVSVTTGVWYRLDVKVVVTSNPWTIDVSVDGNAVGQLTNAVAGSSFTQIRVGQDLSTNTSDVFYDDIIVSNTSGDYPIGAGKVEHFVPTADGTHNIAGTGDFQRTTTGTNILNATTDACQLVDDVPLETGAGTDWINMLAPPNDTDYVECVFGPAPGISTPTVAPRAVEVIAGDRQSATGTGSMEIRMNDNGTSKSLLQRVATAGTTTIKFTRKHYATAIAGGGAWVIGGGGNGDFTDLRVRFGSPSGSLDVNPDQYFTGIMIEAEFSTSGATTLDVDPATYVFTTADAGIQAQRKLDVTNAVYTFTDADVTFNKGYNFPVVEAVYSFAPADVTFAVTRMLIVDPASYSFNTADASILVQRTLSGTEAVYLFTTQDAALEYTPGSGDYNFDVDPAVYSFTTSDASLTVQRLLNVDPASYSFSTEDAGLLRGLFIAVDPASYIFTTSDATIQAQRTLPATEAVYLFTTEDAAFQYSGAGNTVFSVDPATYLFTDGSVVLTASSQTTYNLEVRRAKYKFNTATAQLIGPSRPGRISMYDERE
jgi:hypothetical protein